MAPVLHYVLCTHSRAMTPWTLHLLILCGFVMKFGETRQTKLSCWHEVLVYNRRQIWSSLDLCSNYWVSIIIILGGKRFLLWEYHWVVWLIWQICLFGWVFSNSFFNLSFFVVVVVVVPCCRISFFVVVLLKRSSSSEQMQLEHH